MPQAMCREFRTASSAQPKTCALRCRSETAAAAFAPGGPLAGQGKGWELSPATVDDSGICSACGGQLQVSSFLRWRETDSPPIDNTPRVWVCRPPGWAGVGMGAYTSIYSTVPDGLTWQHQHHSRVVLAHEDRPDHEATADSISRLFFVSSKETPPHPGQTHACSCLNPVQTLALRRPATWRLPSGPPLRPASPTWHASARSTPRTSPFSRTGCPSMGPTT